MTLQPKAAMASMTATLFDIDAPLRVNNDNRVVVGDVGALPTTTPLAARRMTRVPKADGTGATGVTHVSDVVVRLQAQGRTLRHTPPQAEATTATSDATTELRRELQLVDKEQLVNAVAVPLVRASPPPPPSRPSVVATAASPPIRPARSATTTTMTTAIVNDDPTSTTKRRPAPTATRQFAKRRTTTHRGALSK